MVNQEFEHTPSKQFVLTISFFCISLKLTNNMATGIGEKNPWGVEPFIFERDLYMMNELVLTLERIEGDEPKV